MSDDLVKRFDHLGKAADLLKSQTAEITCLRAELDTARLVPPLNPDRWRGAINDALTNWMDSILDDETPKDALRRLIQYEITAALDPAVSQSAADLVATARREGMEMPPEFLEWVKREMPSGTHIHNPEWWASRVWKAAALAAAKEVKP